MIERVRKRDKAEEDFLPIVRGSCLLQLQLYINIKLNGSQFFARWTYITFQMQIHAPIRCTFTNITLYTGTTTQYSAYTQCVLDTITFNSRIHTTFSLKYVSSESMSDERHTERDAISFLLTISCFVVSHVEPMSIVTYQVWKQI